MFEILQRLIDKEAKLRVSADCLTARADLYELGLTPYTAIRLLLAVEREFKVEFPRRHLNRATMQSIESIIACLRAIKAEPGRLRAA